MAKVISQTYSTRRNAYGRAYGRASLQCDTGTAPGNVTMASTGRESGAARLILRLTDAASKDRFEVELGADEVVKLATIILGPTLADLTDQARAKLATVVK